MRASLWLLTGSLLAGRSFCALVSVNAPAIAFFWTTNLNESLSALRPIDANACAPLEVNLVPNGQTVEPVPPFYFLAAPIGGIVSRAIPLPFSVPIEHENSSSLIFFLAYDHAHSRQPRRHSLHLHSYVSRRQSPPAFRFPIRSKLTIPSQQGTAFMLAMVDSTGLSGGLVGKCEHF